MRYLFVLIPLVTLLLTAARSAVPTAQAQEATPAATLASSPLLQQMVDAVNAGDSAALAALYTADGAHEDVPAGVVARGQEEIATFVEGALSQFRDVRLEPVSGGQGGDLAVLEYTFSGTDLATEQPLSYRGALVFELDGNLIRRSADYYDLAAILGQLGLLPSGEAATPAA